MTKDDSAAISEDIDTDAVESNLIQKIGQPEKLVTTPKDLQKEASPQKISTDIGLSVKNTIETIENVAGIENGNEKPRKPGPRSKTRPLEPPAVRDSPTKIKESIAENIKIFEKEAKSLEDIKSLKDTNVWSKSLAGKKTSSAAETFVVDLNQELDKLEMIETTKRILGNTDTIINRAKIALAEILIEEVNHDDISQKQWNNVEIWEPNEISYNASTSKHSEEGIDSLEFDWLGTDDCSNTETILELENYKTNKNANHESESEEEKFWDSLSH